MKKLLLFLVLISYGLVAQTPIWHYTFDGNSAPVDSQGNFGGTLIKLSGGTPDASNYGVDRFGNTASSLVCNGTSMDMMYQGVLGNLPQGSSARSFSFWVRFKSNGDQHVFRYGNYLNQEEITFYKPQSGATTIVRTGPSFLNTVYHGNNQVAIINTDDSLGWHHYTMVIDGNQATFYRNGVLLGNTTILSGVNTTGTTLRFASSTPTTTANAASTNNFLLDDFKVYDQALSHTQIKQMFADEIAFNSNNLVAYYGFENSLNCANNSLYDLSAFASTPFVSGVIGQSRNIVGGAALYNNNVGADIDKSSFTIMYWEKQNADDIPSNYATTLELNGGQYLRRRYTDTYLGFASDATTWHETFTSRPSLNTWIHYSVTVRNINGIFHSLYYRNGELMTITPSNNTTTQIHSFVNKLVLGGGIDANGNLMFSKNVADISLDEVYIYNRELNQSEILSTMYRTAAPTFSSCPSGDVILTTQAEVDALASCTSINGNLTINATTALDLTPLNLITSINGSLQINQLQNTGALNIFPFLNSVGGNIVINGSQLSGIFGFINLTNVPGRIGLYNNSNLTTLGAFGSVTSAGIEIQNSPLLTSLNTFNNLITISNVFDISNTGLSNLSAFASLTTINGYNVFISDNPNLNNISLPSITSIDMDILRIRDNSLLSVCAVDWVCDAVTIPGITLNISGNAIGCESVAAVNTACAALSCPSGDVTLTTQAEVDALASCSTISGFLNVNANNAALDLSPLNNITTINGALTVQGLTNNQLNIFPNLTTVTGSIQIRQNTFTEFSGFNNLTTASNGLQVLQNTNLTSFSGFNSLSFINGSNLGILLNNNLATINAFSNLQNVQGLLIRNTQITNLSFLSSLTVNGGQLSIESNPLLTSANFTNPVVHCFCTGISGGDYVRIQSNPLLTTVGNVTLQSSVLGQPTIEFFQINNNPLLSSVGISLASAINSSVVGNLNINNNPALLNLNFLNNINVTSCATLNISSMPISSLASLTSLTSVGTIQITGNTNLTDISALNNINIGNITSLLISVNPMLSTCAVDWVCDYLATSSPNVAISGNATGCESVAAVNSACAALSTSVFDLASISLYPNPTDAIFSIVVPNEVVKQVEIFDLSGKMLLKSNQHQIDVSSFATGIYMVQIQTESGKKGVSKLIKK